jgi:hypothetical protein
LTNISEKFTAFIIRVMCRKVVVDTGVRQSPGWTSGRGEKQSEGRYSRRTNGRNGTTAGPYGRQNYRDSPVRSPALSTLTLVLSSPIGPARALPCPTYSYIYHSLSVHSSFITLMKEAVSSSETSVNIYKTT